jgi:hypothetical protein
MGETCMASENPTEITVDALDKSSPALANPAVARCCKAWKRAYRAKYDENGFAWSAPSEAAEAFRAAMPSLTSRENCRDFIACVAQGMLLGAIAEKNAGKLLYAAQIALSSVASEERSQKNINRAKKTLDFEPKHREKP